MKTRSFATLLAVFAIGLAGAAAGSDKPGSAGKVVGDAARGQSIAVKWCQNCHAFKGASASDQVPSLSAIAARPGRTGEAMRAFLMQPHDPMPPLQLNNQEVEDLVVFLLALRPVSK